MDIRQYALLAVLVIVVGLHEGAEAATHAVGGPTGWTFQASDLTFYDKWAAEQTFQVGDILVFNYNASLHNVYEVTPADLATCTTPPSPIQSNLTDNGTLTILTAGTHAFLCEKPQHCTFGMKMTLKTAGSTATNATVPPVPSPPTSPSKSDAAGLKAHQFLSNVLMGLTLAACVVLYGF